MKERLFNRRLTVRNGKQGKLEVVIEDRFLKGWRPLRTESILPIQKKRIVSLLAKKFKVPREAITDETSGDTKGKGVEGPTTDASTSGTN